MPNRIVREGILSSERIASLGWPEEVFYRRLMSVVDDYGRYEANPLLLRAKCYPLQIDTVRTADITRWMAACQKAGVLLGYAVNDKQYLELCNFQQQQRSASKFPPPPADASKCLQVISDAHLVVSVFEDVSVNSDEAPPAAPVLPAALPEPDFIKLPLNTGEEHGIPESLVAELSSLYPAVDVRQQLRDMRAWSITNPTKRKTKTGILKFVNTWLSKRQNEGGYNKPSGMAPKSRKEL